MLGSVWDSSSPLILPVTLAVVGASFTTGAAAGLRALGAAQRSLRAQLIASVFYVMFGLIGAVLGGAAGSAWGVAIAADRCWRARRVVAPAAGRDLEYPVSRRQHAEPPGFETEDKE